VFRQLRPRLWRWELPHPEWTPEEGADGGWEPVVASYAAVVGDRFLLFDPIAPATEAQTEPFWKALDDDVRHHGPPAVFLTIFWHARSAARILERYPGASVWAHEPAAHWVSERTPVTHTFAVGDELPAGALAFETGRLSREVVLWLPSHRALVVGDVLLGAGKEGARLCPPAWLQGTTPEEVRARLAPVLELPVELLLLTHGSAIERGARAVLAQALSA
jgi:glyoxylase-like metal-dependent hydrolase (beta-lactamase superfamily II)